MRDLKYMTVVAVAALGLALAGCGGGGTSQSDLNAANDRAAEQAAMVMELQGQINELRAQLGLAEDDDLGDSIEELQGQVTALQKEIDDAAEAERLAQEEADRKAAEEAAAAMMAKAMKLHAGIGASTDDKGAETRRHAVYDNDGNIEVRSGTADAVDLSEDKMAMVGDNHGWMGKRYADPDGGDMYEAVVYSDVGDPTPGDKFSKKYADNLTDGVLNTNTTEGDASLVASSEFDQSAGTKMFKLPDPNPTGETIINIPGSYDGVSGTYMCEPGSKGACSVTVAAKGFTLDGGGTWTFKPDNADDQVMGMPDGNYASYGWWVRTSEDGKMVTASAFVDNKGTDPDSLAIAGLRGTATYMGGAAGQYTLYSSTGGTNDAGEFTATAELNATFGEDHKISGTIDNFMGADGMARDWSVELKEAAITDDGAISDGATTMTVWSIGGTAASASGEWSGELQDAGDDGVPMIATGTFYSEYSTSGKMVGAFGAKR